MKISLPEEFASRPEVQKYVRNKSFYTSVINWIIDWRYKFKTTNLVKWINTFLYDDDLKEIAKQFKGTNDKKIVQIQRYVNDNIFYVPDSKRWEVAEYWQTPQETLAFNEGDCEDGALLIYALAHHADIPDYQLRIACGKTLVGGHAYLVYQSNEDSLEYVIDWCAWTDLRYIPLKEYYVQLKNYYYGQSEWFSFNSSEGYKKR